MRNDLPIIGLVLPRSWLYVEGVFPGLDVPVELPGLGEQPLHLGRRVICTAVNIQVGRRGLVVSIYALKSSGVRRGAV